LNEEYNSLNIVFEGLPASGKTSVLKMMRNMFENSICLEEIVIADFDYRIATQADYVLNDQVKSNMLRHNDEILLFCDRYYYSTLIFDCVLNKRKICEESIFESYNSLYTYYLNIPDYIIYFNQTVDVSYNRIMAGSRYQETAGWWLDKSFLAKMKKWYSFFFNTIHFYKTRLIQIDSMNMGIQQITELIAKEIGIAEQP
jgi:thymidylate kinase